MLFLFTHLTCVQHVLATRRSSFRWFGGTFAMLHDAKSAKLSCTRKVLMHGTLRVGCE